MSMFIVVSTLWQLLVALVEMFMLHLLVVERGLFLMLFLFLVP